MNQKFNLSLLPVYFVLFIDNFAFSVIFAIFGPLFVDPSFGFISVGTSDVARNLMLGTALALYPLGQLIGAPLIGDIADQFGRKKAFYITILGAACGITLTGFSIFTHSFIFLILTRLATGFFAGNLSICLASIADLSPDEKTRAKNFSVIIIVTGCSWMLAILSGGFFSNRTFSEHFSPALPFFITTVLFVITFLGIHFFFKETHKTDKKFHIDILQGARDVVKAFEYKNLKVLYIIYMFWILGWGIAFQWYSPTAIQEFRTKPIDVNWGLFIVGFTWIFGGYFVNNFLVKRYHARPLIVIGNAMITLCLLGMFLAESFGPFALFFGLATIPAAFAWPNTLNLISINAPVNIQGKIMGISQSFQSAGFIFATIVGGITAALSIKSIYFFAMFFVFVSFVLILIKHLKIKKAAP